MKTPMTENEVKLGIAADKANKIVERYMSKDKNFEIQRNATSGSTAMLSQIRVGDMFEREGSLHIRIYLIGSSYDDYAINISTGAMAFLADMTERVKVVKNTVITYDVGE